MSYLYHPPSIRKAVSLLLLLGLLVAAVSVNAQLQTFIRIDTSTVTHSVSDSNATIVAPDLIIDSPDDLDGASVSINNGFLTAEDRLEIGGNTSGTTNGIAYDYNATTGVMTLTGTAPGATYQAVLRQVAYNNTNSASPNLSDREISFNLGTQLFSPFTGHFYEVVFTSQDITWTSAFNIANSSTLFGLQGYLVTLTSAEEDAFVVEKLEGAEGWIGASDDPAFHTGNPNGDKVWMWVNGPEDGLVFTFQNGYRANQSNQPGIGVQSVPNGVYENWRRSSDCDNNEPNDFADGDCPANSSQDGEAGNEDYAHLLPNGEWNDYPVDRKRLRAYIIEYGGSTGDPNVVVVDTVTVNVVEADIVPPTLATTDALFPAPGANDAPVTGEFRVTFDEPVSPGTGTIEIYEAGNPTPVDTIDISNASFDGPNVTFTPTAPLEPGTDYYVNITDGAITDTSDNDFPGITDDSTWAFTTRPFNGGSALNPGDVAIVGYSADDNTFSFGVFVDVPTGTEIKFTDNGWEADDEFRPGEGIVTFTATKTIPAGTVITPANAADFGVLVVSGNFDLSEDGDQLLAYQGDDDAPNFIFGISVNGDWQNDAVNDNTSKLPDSLTEGTSAVALPEEDNYGFTGIISGTRDEILNAIGDPTNWQGDEDNPVGSPFGFTITNIGSIDSTGPVVDNTAPRTPANNATDVPLRPTFTLTFSEPIQAGTGDITIFDENGNPVATIPPNDFTVSVGGTSVSFTPPNDLNPNTTYYVGISGNAIEDTAGNRFGGIDDPNDWRFTTIATNDTTAPFITSTTPTNNQTGVSINTTVVLNFSEPVTFTALPTFTCDGQGRSGTVAPSNGNQTFTGTPNAPLPENATCVLTIPTNIVVDGAGNELQDNDGNVNGSYVLTFTTGELPRIVSLSPANGATNVAPSANIVITFSEPVVATPGSTALICQPGNLDVGTSVSVSGGGTIYTGTPNNPLPRGATCTINIPVNSVVDGDNNSLVDTDGTPNGTYVYTFSTEPVPEPLPQILSTSPANGAQNVKVDANIVFNLSEFVSGSPSTLICQPGNQQFGYGVTPNLAALTYTINPNGNLPFDATCTFQVNLVNALDADNNRLLDTDGVDDGFYNLTFQTEAAPQILSTNPTQGQQNVSVDANIEVTLNEPVNGPGTTLVCQPGGGIGYTDSFNFGQNLYTLNPNAPLPYDALCTLRVIIANTSDADGNRLLDNDSNPGDGFYNLSFRTEPQPLPFVVSTTPTQGASGVSPNSTIVVNLSEPMTPAGVPVPLTCGGTRIFYTPAVTGASQYTLTPNTPLTAGTSCTLSIPTNAVRDGDGNFLTDTDGNPNNAYELTFTVAGSAAAAQVQPEAAAVTAEAAPVIESAE